MTIILIGPPGSGKGTQAAAVAKELKAVHLSVGDVLRNMAKLQTEEGVELSKIMAIGKLVPSDMVNKFVLASLKSSGGECILDGYPRNLEQAEFLTHHYQNKVQVIYFDLDKDILIKRVVGRFSCGNCGRIYNSYFNKTKVDSVCDECGSHDFVFRSDDNTDTVAKRLHEYESETEPVIQYYKARGLLKALNANRSASEITEELRLLLKSR